MGKENIVKKHGSNSKKILIIIGALAVIGLIVASVLIALRSNDIKSVRKILKPKYYNVECLDLYCNGIKAEEGNKLGKSKITLLNKNGKIVAKYTTTYDSKAKFKFNPYQVTTEYFISKKVSVSDNKVVGYTINNRNGKELYATDKVLSSLSEKYIIMKDSSKYSIIDKNGKEIYTNISEYNSYADGNLIYLSIEDQSIILNSKGDQVLSGYKVAREVFDDSKKTAFLVVKDVKNSIYQYFDVKKLEVRGDVFENYASSEKSDELIIIKDENGKKAKYTLNRKGQQKRLEDGFVKVDVVNEIEKKIDTDKYYIYTESIYDKSQNVILVDNLDKKEIGTLDINKKKFSKIYSYKESNSSVYSNVIKLNTDMNNAYLQISCNAYNCGKSKIYVYDMNNQKALYKSDGNDLVAQKYTQYSGGYKVIKYSYSSLKEDYKGAYVLYDKNDKEIKKSTHEIVVIDKTKLFGADYVSSSLVLYSSRNKKLINDEKSTASPITVGDGKVYRYNKDNYVFIVNERGKEIIKTKSGDYLKYSNNSIVYIENNTVKMYDINTNKTRNYKLKANEKLNDGLGSVISPYRGALFVNNSSDNYVKVVNSKGRIIKTIKKCQISSVYQNNKNNNVFIIVKSKNKTGNSYGLYLAK